MAENSSIGVEGSTQVKEGQVGDLVGLLKNRNNQENQNTNYGQNNYNNVDKFIET